MIGIKNNNGFFRFLVAVIMLLSILGLRMRATAHDTVDSYSETFYAFYGFSHMNSTLVTIEQGG